MPRRTESSRKAASSRTLTERDEPVARNALLISLALCLGVGLLALRPALRPPDPLLRAGSAVSAPAPAPTRSSLPLRLPQDAPRRAPLDLTEEQARAGYNECMVPDPGPGSFDKPHNLWRGMLHIPREGGAREDGGFDVLIHFHGGPSARKALAAPSRGLVLAGIDLGNGSGAYSQPFGNSMLFDELRHGIEKQLRAHSNRPEAYIKHLGLSGWSAGYGAINAILRHAGVGAVDAVILLDGLHSGYLPGAGRWVDEQNVAPIFDFARLAIEDQRFFFVTHSQIRTDGYASTTELCDLLLKRLKLRRLAGAPDEDPLGLRSYVDRGGFHLRGFGGTDERAHCDHLRHLTDAVRMLEARWKTPRVRSSEAPGR